MKKLLIIAISLLPFFGKTQENPVPSFYGISAGLSFSFGTHVNRLGVNLSAYYTYSIAQANGGIKGYYNFRSFGLKEKGWELQLSSGFQVGFGRKDSARSPFIGEAENNLLQDYSLGYDYLVYLDNNKTSQTGGILSVNILDFKFATQNDLFGFGQGWRDRFRTGAFLFEYRYQFFKFGISSTIWTDDYTACSKVLDSEYPARFGYKKDNNCKYNGHCISTLGLRVNYILPAPIILSQNAQIDIGIDAEQIRNLVQNKMIHDHYPIPEKLIKRNPCHIPMQAHEGGQFLYKEGQKVEKPSFYFNAGLNQNLFY
ncbi:polymorphic toxin type 23 domain-containing protein [Paracrocinitomix mangrovi]|uniref:polymorphic toxin type 23 domain-containing protein n=1 Tax=Paracrocinitomix mangrovi TaxID=2862509 RepID=UPI001C8D03A0|nr:polymorphic toxin type 23 domain-containing protein [Paracrocinitomix mangrovi]UKN00727.1 polymorphic toxin type 23 domain-containing protein [Paracrocinitomix mangrovi]